MAFVPENRLEEFLVKAVTDPAARPEFYRQLVDAKLFVIGYTGDQPATDVERTLGAGETFSIQMVTFQGKNYHPVFSSLARLQAYVPKETQYLAMAGRDLFAATPGAYFLLNPGSDYGKELLPEEIVHMLTPAKPRTVTVDKPTQVLLGEPAIYPTALVEALKALFQTRPEIVSAHLLQIAYDTGEPHPLIGVQAEGPWQPISQEIGRVVAAAAPELVVDAMPLSAPENDGVADALMRHPPFYERTPSGLGAPRRGLSRH